MILYGLPNVVFFVSSADFTLQLRHTVCVTVIYQHRSYNSSREFWCIINLFYTKSTKSDALIVRICPTEVIKHVTELNR